MFDCFIATGVGVVVIVFLFAFSKAAANMIVAFFISCWDGEEFDFNSSRGACNEHGIFADDRRLLAVCCWGVTEGGNIGTG